MKNVANYLQSLESAVYTESNGKVKQTQARAFKFALLTNLMKDFQDFDFEVGKVQKGFIVRIPNNDLGSLVIQVDAVLKPLDYDFDDAVKAEAERLAEIKAKKSKSKKSAK